MLGNSIRGRVAETTVAGKVTGAVILKLKMLPARAYDMLDFTGVVLLTAVAEDTGGRFQREVRLTGEVHHARAESDATVKILTLRFVADPLRVRPAGGLRPVLTRFPRGLHLKITREPPPPE